MAGSGDCDQALWLKLAAEHPDIFAAGVLTKLPHRTVRALHRSCSTLRQVVLATIRHVALRLNPQRLHWDDDPALWLPTGDLATRFPLLNSITAHVRVGGDPAKHAEGCQTLVDVLSHSSSSAVQELTVNVTKEVDLIELCMSTGPRIGPAHDLATAPRFLSTVTPCLIHLATALPSLRTLAINLPTLTLSYAAPPPTAPDAPHPSLPPAASLLPSPTPPTLASLLRSPQLAPALATLRLHTSDLPPTALAPLTRLHTLHLTAPTPPDPLPFLPATAALPALTALHLTTSSSLPRHPPAAARTATDQVFSSLATHTALRHLHISIDVPYGCIKPLRALTALTTLILDRVRVEKKTCYSWGWLDRFPHLHTFHQTARNWHTRLPAKDVLTIDLDCPRLQKRGCLRSIRFNVPASNQALEMVARLTTLTSLSLVLPRHMDWTLADPPAYEGIASLAGSLRQLRLGQLVVSRWAISSTLGRLARLTRLYLESPLLRPMEAELALPQLREFVLVGGTKHTEEDYFEGDPDDDAESYDGTWTGMHLVLRAPELRMLCVVSTEWLAVLTSAGADGGTEEEGGEGVGGAARDGGQGGPVAVKVHAGGVLHAVAREEPVFTDLVPVDSPGGVPPAQPR